MSQPRYQEVNAETIPTVDRDGATIRIVAGEIDGVQGPVTEIAANPVYLDIELGPGSSFSYPIPLGHTAVAYVFEGEGDFGVQDNGHGQLISAVHLIVFADGDSIQVQSTPDSGVRFMLMAGAPFKEPIVPYGPFVMNTAEEIQQALVDLRNGTFVKA